MKLPSLQTPQVSLNHLLIQVGFFPKVFTGHLSNSHVWRVNSPFQFNFQCLTLFDPKFRRLDINLYILLLIGSSLISLTTDISSEVTRCFWKPINSLNTYRTESPRSCRTKLIPASLNSCSLIFSDFFTFKQQYDMKTMKITKQTPKIEKAGAFSFHQAELKALVVVESEETLCFCMAATVWLRLWSRVKLEGKGRDADAWSAELLRSKGAASPTAARAKTRENITVFLNIL